jgi:hypothetical protein
MTPREVIKRAIEFRTPCRLPIQGYGDISDTVWIGGDDLKPPQAQSDPDLDQWLCRWAHTDVPNMGQIKGHPLEDLSSISQYPWPDPNDPRRYANVPARLAEIEADGARRDKFRVTSIFMLLWERMQALHGFESCMLDMMDNKPGIHELADRLVDYDIAFIGNMHRLAAGRIDCFNFSEDWGTESDLMISPELFRSFFLPRYRRVFGAAHDCGWHVWMHSCGKINKAIPILLEAGVDVLNMQQPLTNGVEEIARDFAGRVCFETLCDIQKTLPSGSRAEIERQAGQLMRLWGRPAGGFILGDYGDHRAIGADPAIKDFMLHSFLRLDPWKTGW